MPPPQDLCAREGCDYENDRNDGNRLQSARNALRKCLASDPGPRLSVVRTFAKLGTNTRLRLGVTRSQNLHLIDDWERNGRVNCNSLVNSHAFQVNQSAVSTIRRESA